MAHKPQIQIYQEYAMQYNDKLVMVLPMDDPVFIARLTKHKLLPSDTNSQLKALPTRADKASYFLNHVIKPALDIDDSSSFDKLLFVMEQCGFDHVEKLAHEIKSKIDKTSDIGPVTNNEEETTEVTRHLKARTLTKLNGKFSSTLSKIMRIFEGKEFEIQQLIINLCAADRTKLTVFSTDDAFSKIQTYHMLSHQIGKYCSIYDYELLEAFVESTDCQEAIEVLTAFTDEMHSSILKELDLLSECGKMLNPDDLMPGTYKFAIEYIGGRCTLETKNTIQNVIHEHFHLQKGTIVFKGVEISCIFFVYQISAAVKSYLLEYQLDNRNLTAFATHNIACLIIDGVEKRITLEWSKKVIKVAHKEAYEKYVEKLINCLPMEDILFITKLFKHKLLPGDTDNQLKALPTQAARALYFLNHVIKPTLDFDDTSSFDNLLSVMEHCGYDHVEKLAGEIKSEFDKESDFEAGDEDLNLGEYRIRFSEDDVETSFEYMLNRLKDLWSVVNLSKLKKAFKRDGRLSDELKNDLESANTLERILDILSKSPFCTWLEIRVLKSMVKVENIPEATQTINLFEKFVYCKSYSEALKHFKQQYINPDHLTIVCIKLNKNAKYLVVADLIEYCQNLESILNLQNSSALVGSKTGCLEVYLVIPKDHCMHAYEAMKDHFLQLRPSNIRFIQIGTDPKFYTTNLTQTKALLTEASSPCDNWSNPLQVINHYYTYLEGHMDADSVSHMMHSEHLITDSDYEAITAAPNDINMNRLLLQYVRAMDMPDLLKFCNLLKNLETQKYIGATLETALKSTQYDETAVSKPQHITSGSSKLMDIHWQMKDINIIFLEMIDRLAAKIKVDIEILSDKCHTLMASDTHNIKLFTDSFIKKLFKCSHSNLLKVYLLPFNTWLDNTILKELVTVAYEKDDTLKLFEFLDDNQPITSYPIPTFSQLIIPLDDSEYTIVATETVYDCNKLTLKDVKDIKELLKSRWELTEHAIQLAAIDYKCIYWMIPKQVKPLIEAVNQDSDGLGCNEIYVDTLLPDKFFSKFDQQKIGGPFIVSNFSSRCLTKSLLEQLDMIAVCSWCYSWLRYSIEDSKRLRKDGCCNSEHQWDSSQGHKSITTVIDESGLLQKVRPFPSNALHFKGSFRRCQKDVCTHLQCTYAHSDLELRAWNKRKEEILNSIQHNTPLIQSTKLEMNSSVVTSDVSGRLTKMKHRRNYELLPESELDEHLLNEPFTRNNYVDKFHTLLYCEEHEHARVLKERCDNLLKISLYETRSGEMYGSLVGLSSSVVAYVQQAASHVEISGNGTTVQAEIITYGVSNKGLDIVNVKFNDEHSYRLLISKIAKQSYVPVHFVLKHSYFKNLHKSLDRINSRIVGCLIPSSLQPEQERLPRIPYPAADFLWLDKEYQLLALKKIMACDNNALFLLTGPFGTGKTRLLAAAAFTFLQRPANRVLICTSHLRSADAYIDNYFGPMTESNTLPHDVNPVRLVGGNYRYSGKYQYLFKNTYDRQELRPIKRSRLIITTFLTAPHLINLKVKCFTHILIDEGAQTREPETIAPLCLADDYTKIVIAGDHLQIGPQALVLGYKALKHGLGQSLLQRLHMLYHDIQPFDNPYTAVLLTNYRCHDSILRLPSNLFFESTLQVRTHNKLHPKTSSALKFVCTSLDSSVVVSAVDYSEEEATLALEQVQFYVDPWPVAQWGIKDLSTIGVIASSRTQVRIIKKLLTQRRFNNIKGVQTLATYELQGLEFRAIFISTLEVTKQDGSTLNPTKTICDQYIFNTVITRAQSMVVCVGNPFLLFSIEKFIRNYGKHEVPIYCWRQYVKMCLETSSFHLAAQCYEISESILQGNIAKLYEETFGDLQESLNYSCGNIQEVSDEISETYKQAFQSQKTCQDVRIILGSIGNGDCGYVLQRSGLQTADKPVQDSSTVGTPIECYLKNITFRKAIATPLDPSQPPITINGVDNRRGALDGSLVKVVLYEGGDRCGQVCEVIKQGPQQQFVCNVDGHNSIFFKPIDHKNPKMVNLLGLSHEMLKQAPNYLIIKEQLNYKQHAVTVFDSKSFITPNEEVTNGSIKFADIQVPQIKDVIPLNIAEKLLFVVLFLRWKPKYRYPLGVVIAAIPRGLTLYHAQRILLAHHHINTASVDVASDDSDVSIVSTIDSSLPQYDHALSIDSPQAQTFNNVLTLEPLDSHHYYQLGVHVANVGKVLNRTSTELDKNARERGIAVCGSKTHPLFYPMLPKKMRENLSLDCNKKASAISITCRVSIVSDNIEIDAVKVHESIVCSRAQLTYENAQNLLNGVKNSKLDNTVRSYNKTLPADNTFGLERRLAVLLHISEFFHKYRTQSDYVDYTIEDDEIILNPQAYFLVREMIIWANRIAAEHVLAAFPELALLQRQKAPNQDQLTKVIQQYKDAIDFSLPHKPLAAKLSIATEPGPFLMTELFRKCLLEALQSGDIKQASSLLRVTSYHPQLAVLSKAVNATKSQSQYVCSGNFQEQEKLELQCGHYLVSLTDAQKEVYGHYDKCCLYTHFTFPLRRYIDIVMQRLILQSLHSSATNMYSLESLKKICDDYNVKVSAAKQFEMEWRRLNLALSLAECSQPCTGYVASIEKSLRLVIQELDCQFLSQDQCSVRLSSVTSGAKCYNNHPDFLLGKSTETEDNKSFVWKAKITSFMSMHTVNKFVNVRECSFDSKLTQDVLFTFYSPELHYESEVDRSTPTERNLFSALAHQCYSAEFPNKPLSLCAEEWAKVVNFMREPSEDTTALLKELLMSHNLTEDGDGVKFPTNASFWLYEVKQSFETYKCFKISLSANFSDYILSPCIQLLEVAPMLNVCIQHNTNPASCFSTPTLSHASRIQYNDINEYIGLWEKVLLAEAAVLSVYGDAEVQLIQNVPLKWPTLRQPSTSLDNIHYSATEESDYFEQEHVGVTLTISDEFEKRCGKYFDIQVGNLICARYNIPLNKQKEVNGRVVKTASAVYHFIIDKIIDPDKIDGTVTKKLKKRSEEQHNKIVRLKIVNKEAARVSKFMKLYVENPTNLCELQIIALELSCRRMYRSLLALKYVAATNPLCKQISLGTAFNSRISTRSVVIKTMLIRKDPLVFTLWSSTQKLNGKQHVSLFNAIKNKFQLIQGPPGTGKSVFGAHLAYAFIVANNPDLRLVPSSDDEKIKCVMYCGPSNRSIDVVLDMFLKHPNLKDLRILRIYNKSIETKYYYGPHSCKVYNKPSSEQECKEDHKEFALHMKIRSKDCSLSSTILQMEKMFEKYSKENKLPSPSEIQSYNDTIKHAEKEIIRAGKYHIVFCTCIEACSVRVVDNIEHIQLIIDDAAMATEPEAMIPIQLADHVTLIGDHMQLQPVIYHHPAKEKGLGYSLFQRYTEILDRDFDMTLPGDSILMLTTQYRMHEKICEFPSEEFYEGKLKADSSVLRDFCSLEGFWPKGPHCPIAFCDTVGKEEEARSHHKESKCNRIEADKIVDIIVALKMAKRSNKKEPNIAVLTPFKAQKELMKYLVLVKKLEVTVSTINECQGSEFDFVIFSTVRSMPRHIIRNRATIQPDRVWIRDHLGFITDRHQICVGITRAKHGLVIVGNALLLSYDETWNRLLDFYGSHGCKVGESTFPLQQQRTPR